ncbi:MAG TPA: hypothetical protein VF316_18575, partial [Polyangiaceae bacterium]
MRAPAPGGDKVASSGSCTDGTPCFVCEMKAIAVAEGVKATFTDAPFTLNIVGCRRGHSISNEFDDRMVVFFALPAAEAEKALSDATIEGDLGDDIAAAAKALNGAIVPGRGVRLVECSRVEIEPGKPAAGHRVVAMFPITTDPGLVRLASDVETAKKALDDAGKTLKSRQDALEAAKKELEDDLADLDKKGKALPKRKLGEKKTQALLDAEKELVDARKKVDDFVKSHKVKAPTAAALDQQIEAAKTEQTKAKKKLDALSANDLTDPEKRKFEGYHYAFWGKDGLEGDGHAFFPAGHHANHFTLGQHHWNSDASTVALTVGSFMGHRMFTGRVLKLEFAKLVNESIDFRRSPVAKAAAAENKALPAAEKLETAALKKDMPANTPAAEQKAKLAELADKQKKNRESIALKQRHAMDDASNEYLVIASHLKYPPSATPAPAGSRIVLSCKVKKADGTSVALPDDDEFEIEGDVAHKGDAPYWRTGKEVRLLYYRLAGKKPDDGLKIHAHHPREGQPLLPDGAVVMPGEPMISRGAALEPLRDDDQFEVEASIGGTNVHRGHTMKISGETVSKDYESLTVVGNWSTGCQVFGAFVDFNLFIL